MNQKHALYTDNPASMCKFCGEKNELCYSHSIPDAFFKLISKDNNGKLIHISTDKSKTHLSQNSGKDKMLCNQCEKNFNKAFDAPIVNALKSWDRQINNMGFGAKLDFSANQLAQALASIFWRASVSKNQIYENAKITNEDRKKLFHIITTKEQNVLKLCSVSARRLYDRLPNTEGGFPNNTFSNIILPVSAYTALNHTNNSPERFAFFVVIMGFVFMLTIPRLPFSQKKQSHYLKPNSYKLHAPAYYYKNFQPLLQIMISGKEKHLDSKLKFQK